MCTTWHSLRTTGSCTWRDGHKGSRDRQRPGCNHFVFQTKEQGLYLEGGGAPLRGFPIGRDGHGAHPHGSIKIGCKDRRQG